MLLSATKLVLRGWSPDVGNDEELYASDLPCLTTSSMLDRSCRPPSRCGPASAVTSSMASALMHSQFFQTATNSSPLLFTHRFPTAPSSDRRAQRNRSRDPGWIPRPRNAFIIFRCDYSREHASAQTSQDSDEQSLSKTLSKRAAEAWRQLSAVEKDKYRNLADREREEHARIYPHYRFRPMRRQASANKKPYFEHVGTTATGTSTDISQNEGEVMPLGSIPEETTKNPERATRRRSSSVPYRNLMSGSPVIPSDRNDRRSFSLIDGIVIAREPSDCVAQITHPLTFDDGGPIAAAGIYPASLQPNAYLGPQGESHSGVWNSVKPTYPMNSTHPSLDLSLPGLPFGDHEETNNLAMPIANGSSSLCGWDGKYVPLSPSVSMSLSGSGYAASASSQGSSSSPPPGSVSASSFVSDQSQEPGARAQSLNQPPCNASPQDIASNFGGGDGTGSFDAFIEHTGGPLPPSYDEMERAQALEAYAIGLQNCDFFSPAPGMYSDFTATPNFDPPQPSFEEEFARLFPEQMSRSMSVETGTGKSDAVWQDGVS